MREIQLTQGMVATVDDIDYDRISRYKWFYHSSGYAMRMIRELNSGRRHMVRMHRDILGITDQSIQIDHKNNNGLCNERWNLRICDQHHNNMNKILYCDINKKTSQYKGVSFDNRRHKWRSTITYSKNKYGWDIL